MEVDRNIEVGCPRFKKIKLKYKGCVFSGNLGLIKEKILISFAVDVASKREQEVCKESLLLRGKEVCMEINEIPIKAKVITSSYCTSLDRTVFTDFNISLENQIKIGNIE